MRDGVRGIGEDAGRIGMLTEDNTGLQVVVGMIP